MSILRRYIAKEFVIFFLICTLSLVFIAVSFSALAELSLLEKENGRQLFIKAILSGIPLLIEVIAPISVLLATVLTFISLSKTSEIIAMMAAGTSLFSLVLPVLLCGVLISTFLYWNQSYLASYLGADKRVGFVNKTTSESLWQVQGDVLYHFASPNKDQQSAVSGKSYYFNAEQKVERIKLYSGITRQVNGWHLDKIREINLPDRAVYQKYLENKILPHKTLPLVFTENLSSPKYSSITLLFQEILTKRKATLDFSRELFALYQKLAGVVAIFVMILLALPFSIYSGRSANVRTGIVVSVVLGFVFWLVDQILISLNNTGSIPAEVSAFGANLIFLSLGLLLIRWRNS